MKMNGHEVVTQHEFTEFKKDFAANMQEKCGKMQRLLTIMMCSCVTLAITSICAIAFILTK